MLEEPVSGQVRGLYLINLSAGLLDKEGFPKASLLLEGQFSERLHKGVIKIQTLNHHDEEEIHDRTVDILVGDEVGFNVEGLACPYEEEFYGGRASEEEFPLHVWVWFFDPIELFISDWLKRLGQKLDADTKRLSFDEVKMRLEIYDGKRWVEAPNFWTQEYFRAN